MEIPRESGEPHRYAPPYRPMPQIGADGYERLAGTIGVPFVAGAVPQTYEGALTTAGYAERRVLERLNEAGVRPVVRQFYEADGVLCEGAFPNRDIQQALHEQRLGALTALDTYIGLVDAAPNLNRQFAADIAAAREAAAVQLSDRAAQTPVSILDENVYERIAAEMRDSGLPANAMHTAERLVAIVSSDTVASYGGRIVGRLLAQNYAQAHAANRALAVGAERFDVHQGLEPGDEVVGGYRITTNAATGYELPDGGDRQHPSYDGSFFEQGRAESYAVLQEAQHDPDWVGAWALMNEHVVLDDNGTYVRCASYNSPNI